MEDACMTFEELLKDEKKSEELVEKVISSKTKDDAEFLAILTDEVKKYGVEASAEELRSFLEKVPLTEEELDHVNGGYWFKISSDETSPLAFALLKVHKKSKKKNKIVIF